jgi:hypothetical protein
MRIEVTMKLNSMHYLLGRFVIGVLLCVSITTTACTENQVKIVKQSMIRIARVTDTAISLVPDFQASGDLDESEAAQVMTGLNDLKSAVDEFNRRAASYSTFDATAKADLAKAFGDVTAALANLNEKGVLHVKNPKVKGRLQMGLAAANLAAQEVADALGEGAQ